MFTAVKELRKENGFIISYKNKQIWDSTIGFIMIIIQL